MKRIIKLMFVAMMLQTKAPALQKFCEITGKDYQSCLFQLTAIFNEMNVRFKGGEFKIVVLCEGYSNAEEQMVHIKLLRFLSIVLRGVVFTVWDRTEVLTVLCGYAKITAIPELTNGIVNKVIITLNKNETTVDSIQWNLPLKLTNMSSVDSTTFQNVCRFITDNQKQYHNNVEKFREQSAAGDELARNKLVKLLQMNPRNMYFSASSYTVLLSRMFDILIDVSRGVLNICEPSDSEEKLVVVNFRPNMTDYYMNNFFQKMGVIEMMIFEEFARCKREKKAGLSDGHPDILTLDTLVLAKMIGLFPDCRIEERAITLFVGSTDEI